MNVICELRCLNCISYPCYCYRGGFEAGILEESYIEAEYWRKNRSSGPDAWQGILGKRMDFQSLIKEFSLESKYITFCYCCYWKTACRIEKCWHRMIGLVKEVHFPTKSEGFYWYLESKEILQGEHKAGVKVISDISNETWEQRKVTEKVNLNENWIKK